MSQTSSSPDKGNYTGYERRWLDTYKPPREKPDEIKPREYKFKVGGIRMPRHIYPKGMFYDV